MKKQAGTAIRAKTVRRERAVDCRDWLEFEISEITMHSIRYTYRVAVKAIDTEPVKAVESRAKDNL